MTKRLDKVEEEYFDEGQTLLSRQYHWVCPMCLIIYVALQLLIGLKSGLGDTTTSDMDVGTRAYYFYNGGATSFIVSAVQQAVKIFECRLQPGKRRSAEAIYFAVFTVNIIAASSFLLTFLLNYGGVCTDVFGVVSNTSQWAEWLVTVPLMVYMTLAIEDKERLTNRDLIILVVFVLAIAFGFLLNFRDMGIAWGIVLFVLGCCSITVNFWLDMSYGNKLSNELTIVDGNIDYGAMNRTSKQRTLSRLFLFAFPCFPATHIAAHVQLLTREQVFIAYGLCSLIAKLLFAGSVSDAHIGLAGGIQNLKLVTEKALNHTRRQFLRYVFHEVRVPLNTITMGLIVLKEEESVLCQASKEALDMMGGATNFMSDTLNDCLSLQRIEDSKMTIVKKRFTMGALIKGATLAVKGNADAKEIVIKVESTLDLYHDQSVSADNSPHRNITIDAATLAAATIIKRDKFYIGDQFRLEHVVMNFLSNAIKFSPVGSTVNIVISGVERKIPNPLRKPVNVARRPHRSFHSLVSLVSNAKSSSKVGKAPGGGDGGANTLPEMVDICDVTVLVKDSGAGISKQDQEQLFQMYSQIQADTLQQGKGSGLGLVLAKEIINLHGGTVIFESEEGKGSSFGFCIPFEVQSSSSIAQGLTHGPSVSNAVPHFDPNSVPIISDSPRNPSSPKESNDFLGTARAQDEVVTGGSKAGDLLRAASNTHKSKGDGKEDDGNNNNHTRNIGGSKGKKQVAQGTKVLIVDDTESNRKMLSMVLRGYGIECEFGADGKEALDKVKSKPMDYYNLIFMDQMMPIMTGMDATKAIRSLGYSNLILGLTGNALEQDRDEFLACGCDCVFPKPIRQIHIDAILYHIDQHGFKSTVGTKYLVDGDTHEVHMSRKAQKTSSH